MKALMKFSINKERQVIDLEHYGHDPETEWTDLSEEDKCEIRDSLTEQMLIECWGENHYSF